MVHVPYKGPTLSVQDVMAGRVEMTFGNIVNTLPQVRAGKLRAIAVSSLKRWPHIPEVPTVAESGYPGFEAISWQAVLAPAGTPQPVIDRLYRELVAIIGSADVRDRMRAQYFVPAGTAPASLRQTMVSEKARWDKVIRAAGVQPE